MSITTSDVIAIVRREIPAWNEDDTVDTVKCGDADAPIRGIACTFMATPEVLRRAAELGASLVITHEPTFYQHLDIPDDESDPVVLAKRALIDDLGLTVWRCHDSIHRMTPDGILLGQARALGWDGRQTADRGNVFEIPPTRLQDLVAHLKQALQLGGVRWVGQADMTVRRAALSSGAQGWPQRAPLLRDPSVDVVILGEHFEWEACEYVRDSNQLGRPRGLVALGHRNSEEAGMAFLADWLRERVPQVPVHFVPAGDPFRHD